jgi:protein tyrosine phosphatase (PTP) superfamily phosphohydrolase (DUF442 family)
MADDREQRVLAEDELYQQYEQSVITELERELAAPARRRSIARVCVVSFVVFMVLGNVAIAAASLVAQRLDRTVHLELPGVHNGFVVDDKVWRGAAPGEEAYRSLAAAGAATIVDLRAEDDLEIDRELLRELGLRRVHIPIRDGQRPSDAQVRHFIEVVNETRDGTVFVHCGAGVGRTGSIVAAYRLLGGTASRFEVLRDNLTAGPPSLEQLSYAANSSITGTHDPNPILVGASRVLDAPRRIWSYIK